MEMVVAAPALPAELEMALIRDITVAAEAQAKEGDTFFLITTRWWQSWIDYVIQDLSSVTSNGSHHHEFGSKTPRRPGPIDNTDLIDDTALEVSNMEIEIHDALVEGRDYILLPQQVWEKLHGWYGGGPTLPRKAINTGFSHTDLTIEVYPLRLQLLLMSRREQTFIRISKKDTVGALHKRACEAFELVPDEVCIWDYYGRTKHTLMDYVHHWQVCIWDYYGRTKHTLMDNLEKTLDDANIQMDQDILVEITTDGNGNVDGGCMSLVKGNDFFERESASLITDASGSGLPNENFAANHYASRGYNSSLTPNLYLRSPNGDIDNVHGSSGMSMRVSPLGLTGLLNLGNTCYMNSAIQCLVHTPQFTRYFCEDYHREINRQNPLGNVGELALAFGELLRKLWAPGGRAPVSPRPFKMKLSRFASQFSGYNQHDSQELLAFLLDGLHEDLNRVKHRPYINSGDADGRSDEEVADEYWANHIARNNSIIVDVCQGQYKSTLVCPVCAKVSVTFDPFMYLSLPLQFASTRSMTVVVFSCYGSLPPTQFTVNVPKQGRCRDLLQALGNACSLKNGEKLLIAEIRNHKIYRFLEDPVLQLSTISDEDRLAVYRLPKLEKRANYIQFVHRREDLEHGNNNRLTPWKPYGVPLLAQIPRNETVTSFDIHELVCKMLLPMLRNQDSPHLAAQSFDSSKFQLQLIDDSNTVIEKSNDTIRVPQSSLATVFFVNWSKADLKKINTHHLEDLPEVFMYAPPAKRTRGEALSLYACLDAFLREEPLVPEDMWYCPRCKEQRQASKKLDLWRLPEVLVIHLKRFSFSRSTKQKLETFVNFPLHNLDLTNYIANKKSSERQMYELYAVSNHYGSMASGHYTAHIKLVDENRWYNFDDSHVLAIDEDEVKTAAAYVLFYRRVREQDGATSNGSQLYATRSHRFSHR